MTEIDRDYLAARLNTARAELLDLESQSQASAATVELDQSRQGRLSRIDALQAQAVSQHARRRRGLQLARIDAALARIAADDYGWCLGCGEEIAPRRLQFDPATPYCIRCAEQKEGEA